MWQFDENGSLVWIDSINRGIDVLGAWASRSPYYSPDDPRFQRGGGGVDYPIGYGGAVQPGGLVPGSVTQTGFQLNWWTAALLGVVVGAFILGKKGR